MAKHRQAPFALPEEGVGEASAPRHVVAIAASAGGIKALSQVLGALDPNCNAAIVVVEHLLPRRRSYLDVILGRATELPVLQAAHGMEMREGRVYIAPPDHHLLVDEGCKFLLSKAQPFRFNRPSADILFQSVAEAFGPRAIAVVLSGMGRDGTEGVRMIKERGGRAICQDEATSEFFSMPSSAIGTGLVDEVLALDEIGPAIARMCGVSPRTKERA